MPHDAGAAGGGPGWSPACSPGRSRFLQRGFKFLNGGIARLRIWCRVRNAVRGVGKLRRLTSRAIGKLGVQDSAHNLGLSENLI